MKGLSVEGFPVRKIERLKNPEYAAIFQHFFRTGPDEQSPGRLLNAFLKRGGRLARKGRV